MRRIASVLLLVAVGCGGGGQTERADPTAAATASPGRATVRFAEAVVVVEVVDEPEELQRGLMFREELAPDAGMLFVMGAPSTTGFWMKNTLIPLSIAFMRETREGRFEVVAIRDMEPCPPEERDCPLYDPNGTYDVALEVNRGWFADHGVDPGDVGVLAGEPTAQG